VQTIAGQVADHGQCAMLGALGLLSGLDARAWQYLAETSRIITLTQRIACNQKWRHSIRLLTYCLGYNLRPNKLIIDGVP
jgi:hypothetical protein